MSIFPRTGWTLDHIGHAVENLDEAERFYVESLGFQVEAREISDTHLVRISFVRGADSLIELIAPLDGNATLQKFLARRGSGLHHLAYRVKSVSEELAALEAAGWPLIDRAPREGSRGLWVGFLHPRAAHGILLELCGER